MRTRTVSPHRPAAGTSERIGARRRGRDRDTLANRVWNAWWRREGTPLDAVRQRVDEDLPSAGIPFALVAHRDGRFVGTASVVENDLAERADLSPWAAAVWVEPPYRRAGIGRSLVAAAARAAVRIRPGAVYLCAAPSLAPFYERLGWRRIQADVGGVDVFERAEDGRKDAIREPQGQR